MSTTLYRCGVHTHEEIVTTLDAAFPHRLEVIDNCGERAFPRVGRVALGIHMFARACTCLELFIGEDCEMRASCAD